MSRQFHRRTMMRRVVCLVVVGAVVGARVLYDHSAGARAGVEAVPAGKYHVVQVANGVTLVVTPNPAGKPRQDRQQARVRLLGIKTPPPAWESEAEAFTRAFVWQQKDVQLRLDRRRVDEDGVFLAYVLVNGRLLNAELLRQGLTRSATHPADSGEMVRKLSHAEVEARRLGRGIWATDATLTTAPSRSGI